MGFYNVLDRALLQPGQNEDISKVLENLDAIATVLNGGLDDTNFAGGLIFDPAKIKQAAAVLGQYLAWDGAKYAPTTNPMVTPTWIAPNGPGSATGTVTANMAILTAIPNLVVPFVFNKMGGAMATGAAINIDMGFYYTDDHITFTRVFSTGSTAESAGNYSINNADTTLTPVAGRTFYYAFATSSGTATFPLSPAAAVGGNLTYTKTTSFPLPATLTPGSNAVQYPWMWAAKT